MKFPRSEDDGRRLTVEVAAHPVIADRLGRARPGDPRRRGTLGPVPVPVGRLTAVRVGDRARRSRVPIIQPKAWARTTLAREVAQALTTLHTTPTEGGEGRGDRARIRWTLDPQVDVGEDAIAWARRIAGDAVDAFLSDPLAHGAPAAPRPGVLCHADLKGEHLFVSEDGTRLTAIVDWADAAIADPAADLAGLAIWLGPAFVREVLRSYDGPADEGTYHRAVFLARAGLLGVPGSSSWPATSEPAPVAMLDAQLRAVFRDEDARPSVVRHGLVREALVFLRHHRGAHGLAGEHRLVEELRGAVADVGERGADLVDLELALRGSRCRRSRSCPRPRSSHPRTAARGTRPTRRRGTAPRRRRTSSRAR